MNLVKMKLVRVIGDVKLPKPSNKVDALVCFLGHSFVAGPEKIADDIYSSELEAFNHFYFGVINVYWDVYTTSLPEVNHNILCLAVVLAPGYTVFILLPVLCLIIIGYLTHRGGDICELVN